MYDYHIHSTFSPDSAQTLEQICIAAISMNICEIALTDHIDKSPGFAIDYEKYKEEIDNITKKFKQGISIKTGVEIGVRPVIIDKIVDYLEKYQFDFIIASTHYVDNNHLSSPEFTKGKSQYQLYKEYFENLLFMVNNFKNYSVLGHFDLIMRYINYENVPFKYSVYSDIIDEILKKVIDNNKGIEINTSNCSKGMEFMMPNADVIKRYKELGGSIITVGSDAHKANDVGFKIKETYQILKDLGFKYITRFNKLEPIFEKI